MHRDTVVPSAEAHAFVQFVRLGHGVHVDIYAQAMLGRHLDVAAFNFQRFLGQTLTVLPDPVRVDGGDVSGAAAATWVNIANEISKWLLE